MKQLPKALNTSIMGAIIGDIVGSTFERSIWIGENFATARCTGYDKPPRVVDRTGEAAILFNLFDQSVHFTDDTVLSIAIMEWCLESEDLTPESLIPIIKKYYQRYPKAGYGKMFKEWAKSTDTNFSDSWANGAAMRVSPVAFVGENILQVQQIAKNSAMVTHNSKEGIDGAVAIAKATHRAMNCESYQNVLDQEDFILGDIGDFGYEISSLARIRCSNKFSTKAIDTVPIAFSVVAASDGFEDTLRNAISLGGDTDTIAAMACSIAGAFYGVPQSLANKAWQLLDEPMRDVLVQFNNKFGSLPRNQASL